MKNEISLLKSKLDELEQALGIQSKIKKTQDLEKQTLDPSFWNDNLSAKKILKKIDENKKWVKSFEEAKRNLSDSEVLLELYEEDNSNETYKELEQIFNKTKKKLSDLEFQKMLNGENDHKNAILEIHSGAGGTESQDWAQMILRMYSRFFEKNGYESEIIDIISGEEVGIKTAVLEVHGEYAFGYLKAETGVHRLVRISPFDSNARRHTSFASVHSIPIIEESDEIKIPDSEIRVDTYRASGAGGQHVNKTDSAVRMVHEPTGIIAQCQSERSQIRNRETCLKLLTARVAERYRQEEEKKRDSQSAEKKKIEWGSQIRSYILHPYNMVKDHRTQTETSNPSAVLDGDIIGFIKAYLMQK